MGERGGPGAWLAVPGQRLLVPYTGYVLTSLARVPAAPRAMRRHAEALLRYYPEVADMAMAHNAWPHWFGVPEKMVRPQDSLFSLMKCRAGTMRLRFCEMLTTTANTDKSI